MERGLEKVGLNKAHFLYTQLASRSQRASSNAVKQVEYQRKKIVTKHSLTEGLQGFEIHMLEHQDHA